MSNTITAYFKGRVGVAESVYQNDYGIVMAFDSIDLPAHFDCYFSRLNQVEALPGLGADNRVTIPNSILANPGNVTIHIPLHTGEDDSEVEYVIYFKVIGRARPIDDGTPAQMTAIERALALLSQPITNIEEIVNEALSFTGDTFAEMKQDLENVEADFVVLQGQFDTVESDFAVLQGQFDTAVAAVTTDTEVTDIRVGADGVTDTTAGHSVRRQFSDIRKEVEDTMKGIGQAYYTSTGIKRYIDIDMPVTNGDKYSFIVTKWTGSSFDSVTFLGKNGETLTSLYTASATIGTKCTLSFTDSYATVRVYLATLSAPVTNETIGVTVINENGDTIFKTLKSINYVTPEFYGAKGDGTTDDSSAIQTAINTGACVVFDGSKVYAIDSITFTNEHNKCPQFNGCTLKKTSNNNAIIIDDIIDFSIKNVNIIDDGDALGAVLMGRMVQNLTIDTVSIRRTTVGDGGISRGSWTCILSGSDIHIHNIFLDNHLFGVWGDGLHFGWVRNLLIDGFDIRGGDDAIAFVQQPTARHTGNGDKAVDGKSENIVIKNGYLYSEKARCLSFGVELGDVGDPTIPNHYINNVVVSNVVMESASGANAVQISDNRTTVNRKNGTLTFDNVDFGDGGTAYFANVHIGLDAKKTFTKVSINKCRLNRSSALNYAFSFAYVDFVYCDESSFDSSSSANRLFMFNNVPHVRFSRTRSALNSERFLVASACSDIRVEDCRIQTGADCAIALAGISYDDNCLLSESYFNNTNDGSAVKILNSLTSEGTLKKITAKDCDISDDFVVGSDSFDISRIENIYEYNEAEEIYELWDAIRN